MRSTARVGRRVEARPASASRCAEISRTSPASRAASAGGRCSHVVTACRSGGAGGLELPVEGVAGLRHESMRLFERARVGFGESQPALRHREVGQRGARGIGGLGRRPVEKALGLVGLGERGLGRARGIPSTPPRRSGTRDRRRGDGDLPSTPAATRGAGARRRPAARPRRSAASRRRARRARAGWWRSPRRSCAECALTSCGWHPEAPPGRPSPGSPRTPRRGRAARSAALAGGWWELRLRRALRRARPRARVRSPHRRAARARRRRARAPARAAVRALGERRDTPDDPHRDGDGERRRPEHHERRDDPPQRARDGSQASAPSTSRRARS